MSQCAPRIDVQNNNERPKYNNLVRDDFSVSGGEKMAWSYENILDLRLTIPTVICRKMRFLTFRGDNSETMFNARVMKLKEFIAIASFNSILQLLDTALTFLQSAAKDASLSKRSYNCYCFSSEGTNI